MAAIEIIPYSTEHDAQIRTLCQLPVSGNISLALEREPYYYKGAAIQCNLPEIYVCLRKADHRVLGVFNVGFRNVYYEGRETQIRYLCDLRIHSNVQGGSLLFRIIRFVEQLNLSPNGLPAQTIVFGDNDRMLSMIKRSRSSSARHQLPTYHHAGKYLTMLLGFYTPAVKLDNIQVRCAVDADLSDIQDFLDVEGKKIDYFPVYRLGQLQNSYYTGIDLQDFFLAIKDNRIVGICGVWDQSSFKQTRITGYSSFYTFIRPLYNLLSKVRGEYILPPSGTILNYLNLHTILISERDPEIFKSLVMAILHKYQHSGYKYLLCGLDTNDPLTHTWKSFKHRREIIGHYFLVNHEEKVENTIFKPWYYLEAARI